MCSYSARFTPGYWKNHLTYDAKNPSNPWTANYLPQALGNFTVGTAATQPDSTPGPKAKQCAAPVTRQKRRPEGQWRLWKSRKAPSPG